MPHLRRSSALAAGVLLVAAPVLSSCAYGERLDHWRGFEYATDKVNTISAGVNDRSATVDLLGAVVIADQDGVGVFAASLVNQDTAEEQSVTSFSGGDDGAVQVLDGTEFSPIAVPASGIVSLFGPEAIPVTGSFVVGDFVTVSMSFSTDESVTVEVPVVKPCSQYDPATLDITMPEPPGVPAAGEELGDEVEADGEPNPYSCEIESAPLGGHGSEGEEH